MIRIIRVSPPLFKTREAFRSELNQNLSRALEKIRKRQILNRNSVVSTWKHKPRWITRKNVSREKLVMTIGFNGWGEEKSAERIWLWLDEGTEVRYAVMTDDFQAKTAPRQLVSKVGRGGLLYVGKKRMDGIEPRHFDNELMVTLAPRVQDDINRAILESLRR